ncbi:hypothetical protein SOCE26_080750 [Sorangium cellulosum]|uniref:Cytochrome c domain-containing protein n=1 Tax=Sorangium cellulosum TaxID=56 RepID=A0A2L0F559_SORCE|nr:hypothetical protein [Sorangium cellulosum]AUX46569.1 hypothetical protein SOCE26_080750 [Sorangium cellulosum]
MATTPNTMISRGILLPLGLLALVSCRRQPQPGHVLDEARSAGRTAASLRAAEEDYFHDMDFGLPLTPDEVKGRNTWILWSGGNDRFWDRAATISAGGLDFLKTLSSHPGLKFGRDNRWSYFGLVNEPCMEKATGPDPTRFGLWLDKRREGCPPDPFEDESKYPGVRIGARGKNIPVGSLYGYATGVVGLRLFPNPDFDEEAAREWDPVRYYEDPSYYYSRNLVRPYRVGMSCGFCHVSPSPTDPPADPENPRWANLSSTVGAQFLWWDRVTNWEADETSFTFQVFRQSRPGTLDTSLVSTDYITNPRTMNAVYEFGPRLQQARRWGKETLRGGELENKQLNDFVHGGPLTQHFEPPATVWTPRVLKEGSDSVGPLGALNRVYMNIGLFSEEWLLHFNPFLGGRQSTPMDIGIARRNSAYWEATEHHTFDTAQFLLPASKPHRLRDAPGGSKYLSKETETLTRGKEVFAERCARCHSSKLPERVPALDPGGCAGPGYLDCFNRYWEWTKTDAFKKEMRQIVLKDDFLEGNFLSTDLRIPVTLLETNACSPLASNAIEGNVWENFSSSSFKSLPAVGTITVHHPITGEPRPFQMPGGGRGYTRVPSLISLWSTAPFLLNNTVGKFNPSPSVEARMDSFEDAIQKMLWPERREKDVVLGDKVPGFIDRTTVRSYLRVPAGYLPGHLRSLLSPLARMAPWLVGEGGIELGPIPAGTPVNLLANLALTAEGAPLAERLAHEEKLLAVLIRLKRDLKALPSDASDEQAREVFRDLTEPLLELSQCPDYVLNRGHYFGTSYFTQEPGLSDEDKRALIELLKTF